MRLKALPFLLAAGAIASVTRSASAETILTPYAGITFSGDTVEDRVVYGGSLAFTGHTGLGLRSTSATAGLLRQRPRGHPREQPDHFDGQPDVQRRARAQLPHLRLGRGRLLKSGVHGANDFFDVDRNDFGVNAGGGIIIGLGERVGIRGDIRYFRNVGSEDPNHDFNIDFGSFSFWRATGGLAFTF
jgi:hypothetical protein